MNELNELLRFIFLVIAGMAIIIGVPTALIIGKRHKEREQNDQQYIKPKREMNINKVPKGIRDVFQDEK